MPANTRPGIGGHKRAECDAAKNNCRRADRLSQAGKQNPEPRNKVSAQDVCRGRLSGKMKSRKTTYSKY